MKCVIWNVRGMNKRSRHRVIISLIRSQKVDLVGFVETKVKENKCCRVAKKFWKDCSYLFNYSSSPRGRVWLLWDPHIWNVSKVLESEEMLTCFFSQQLGWM